MIVTAFQQKTSFSVNTVLEASSIRFYLTGSRFVGNFVDTSDWDYFTKFDEATITWLESQGFYSLEDENNSYEISSMRDVRRIFEHASGIHVQLVNDPQLKWKMQVHMKGFLRILDKPARKSLWKLAYKLVSLRD